MAVAPAGWPACGAPRIVVAVVMLLYELFRNDCWTAKVVFLSSFLPAYSVSLPPASLARLTILLPEPSART